MDDFDRDFFRFACTFFGSLGSAGLIIFLYASYQGGGWYFPWDRLSAPVAAVVKDVERYPGTYLDDGYDCYDRSDGKVRFCVGSMYGVYLETSSGEVRDLLSARDKNALRGSASRLSRFIADVNLVAASRDLTGYPVEDFEGGGGSVGGAGAGW